MTVTRKYVLCDGCRYATYGGRSYVEVEMSDDGKITNVAPGALVDPNSRDREDKSEEQVICAACLADHRIFSFDGPRLPGTCKDREAHRMYHVTQCQCPCEL